MSEIKLKPTGGGAGSVSLKAPTATTGNADVPFVLPVADGSAGQYLKTDGSKNLAFATVSVGGATNISFNSGNGIDFSATSDGGTGTPVELLDDYEEGIWAPDPDVGTCTVGHASYTKIGDIITGFFQVSGFSNTSAANAVSISLPFAVQGSKNGSTGFNTTIGAATGKHIDSAAQSLTPTLTVNSTGSLAYFAITSDSDSWDNVRHQDLESNHVLQGFFTYKVA